MAVVSILGQTGGGGSVLTIRQTVTLTGSPIDGTTATYTLPTIEKPRFIFINPLSLPAQLRRIYTVDGTTWLDFDTGAAVSFPLAYYGKPSESTHTYDFSFAIQGTVITWKNRNYWALDWYADSLPLIVLGD